MVTDASVRVERVGRAALARIVERSHPDCRKPVRRSFRFNRVTGTQPLRRMSTAPLHGQGPRSRVSNGVPDRRGLEAKCGADPGSTPRHKVRPRAELAIFIRRPREIARIARARLRRESETAQPQGLPLFHFRVRGVSENHDLSRLPCYGEDVAQGAACANALRGEHLESTPIAAGQRIQIPRCTRSHSETGDPGSRSIWTR
jgi:hypothetical protein